MRVRLLTGRVGPRGSFKAGDVIDVPPGEARAMIAHGRAEAVAPSRAAASAPPTVPSEVETAAAAPAAELAATVETPSGAMYRGSPPRNSPRRRSS